MCSSDSWAVVLSFGDLHVGPCNLLCKGKIILKNSNGTERVCGNRSGKNSGDPTATGRVIDTYSMIFYTVHYQVICSFFLFGAHCHPLPCASSSGIGKELVGIYRSPWLQVYLLVHYFQSSQSLTVSVYLFFWQTADQDGLLPCLRHFSNKGFFRLYLNNSSLFFSALMVPVTVKMFKVALTDKVHVNLIDQLLKITLTLEHFFPFICVLFRLLPCLLQNYNTHFFQLMENIKLYLPFLSIGTKHKITLINESYVIFQHVHSVMFIDLLF